MIPQGHTTFSWKPVGRVPLGHTSFSIGNIGGCTELECLAEGGGESEVLNPPGSSMTEKHPVQALPANQPLPDMEGEGFSVMSYNVLLPNSQDGWWIYKNYQKHIPAEHRQWEHRCRLLEHQLTLSNADIICVQEASGDSFESDFAFMKEAGYDCAAHNKGVNKGRMRPATFWKQSRFELLAVIHKYRVLVTVLREIGEPFKGKYVFVVNCHLTAGPNPDQRLRQVFDGVDQVRKEINKLKGASAPSMEEAPVIVCGDFNAEGSNGVHEFLTTGKVTPDTREPNYPEIKLTSKAKKNPFCFKDCFEEIYRDTPFLRPSTFHAPLLEEKFFDAETGSLSVECKSALEKMFLQFSSDKKKMIRPEVDEWLVRINGLVGRGSEFRKAVSCFETNGAEELSLEDFVSVYVAELEQGKFWGVEHDMYVCKADFGAWSEYKAIFDYVYFSGALDLLQVQQPLSKSQLKQIEGGDCIPNSWHPSDHLPVAAIFRYQ